MPFKATEKDEDTSFKPSGHVSSTLKKKKRTRSQTEVNSIDAETPLPRRRTRQSISAPDKVVVYENCDKTGLPIQLAVHWDLQEMHKYIFGHGFRWSKFLKTSEIALKHS
ncbi:hypothetical protein K435DRAFT_812475 [Dendrothele bispora CBS 962.96]|uniref:Uncharacterized protein n=1 Tax=Dendrothele bispora (strain CBS 962.96) TaxID=1314807 RepID=A0A4V4HB05_DENBC|nr:hypothetical protein K435DRAFT_812475 [Dendrothele bispora CBS 962.96]